MLQLQVYWRCRWLVRGCLAEFFLQQMGMPFFTRPCLLCLVSRGRTTPTEFGGSDVLQVHHLVQTCLLHFQLCANNLFNTWYDMIHIDKPSLPYNQHYNFDHHNLWSKQWLVTTDVQAFFDLLVLVHLNVDAGFWCRRVIVFVFVISWPTAEWGW